MECKLGDEQVFDSGNFQPAVSHPCGLDSGNPCRNDGLPTLVYNDVSRSLGTSQITDVTKRVPMNLSCSPVEPFERKSGL